MAIAKSYGRWTFAKIFEQISTVQLRQITFCNRSSTLFMTSSILPPSTSGSANTESWFEYPIRVQPHHTDYGGVVWHGAYITWMETARVECLRAFGSSLEEVVRSGYDLPVVRLDVRYRRPLTLGTAAVVKTRLAPINGIRLSWLYEIETVGPEPVTCLTGQVILVPVDVARRRAVRRMPEKIKEIMVKVSASFGANESSV